jgi:hypothetical protein
MSVRGSPGGTSASPATVGIGVSDSRSPKVAPKIGILIR